MKKWYYVAGIIVVVLVVGAIFLAIGQKTPSPSTVNTSAATTASSTAPTATTTTAAATTTAPKSTPPAKSAPSTEMGAFFNEKTSPTLGTYLTDENGRTLYVSSQDSLNLSNCKGACLQVWQPYGPGISNTGTFNLPMLPANVNVIKGNLGMLQFTWKEMPLYYYSKDTAPGQIFGNGENGTWSIVIL